ncbi:unnamed protein product [Schistosoma turkestanicum]|nr:unnamed protein product [Schistosoma turkestanicum]
MFNKTMKYNELNSLIYLVCIVLIFGAINVQGRKLVRTSGNDINEMEDDFKAVFDMIDKRKFGPSDETDPPGWETDTKYEKEIRIGKVKRGGKAGSGQGIEKIVFKKKKPFDKKDSRPGNV